ncbi:MAG: indole-3-glycerol phosphate synthase TrpC [Armatimonadetes bacterium]|nr:indole-3-glycerol phosphate synthase TrpC [Armatimonadota bacterium]
MTDILDEIMAHKRAEVELLTAQVSCDTMRARMADAPPPRDFAAALRRDHVGIIAEIKSASPSAGVIRERDFDPARIAVEYEEAGAAALSVLTDEKYFHGHMDHLTQAREATSLPVLCKDFIYRRYQIYRARAAGADALLLIVAALDPTDLSILVDEARSLDMTPLVEVHDLRELALAPAAGAQVVGVNNRDLTTFAVDPATTERIAPAVPADCVLVGESGIYTRDDVERLAAAGVDAVLVGTALMRADAPGEVLAQLVGVPRRERGAAGTVSD